MDLGTDLKDKSSYGSIGVIKDICVIALLIILKK